MTATDLAAYQAQDPAQDQIQDHGHDEPSCVARQDPSRRSYVLGMAVAVGALCAGCSSSKSSSAAAGGTSPAGGMSSSSDTSSAASSTSAGSAGFKAAGVKLEPELMKRIDDALGDIVEKDPAKTKETAPQTRVA